MEAIVRVEGGCVGGREIVEVVVLRLTVTHWT